MSAILDQLLSDDNESNEQQEQLKKLARRYLLLLGIYQDQIEQILAIDGMVSQICRIVGLEVLHKLDNRSYTKPQSQKAVVLPIKKPKLGTPKNKSLGAPNKVFLPLKEISTYPGLSEYFQKAINGLKEIRTSQWQQKIDAIITGWNKSHPDAIIYKYHPSGGKIGESWKDEYKITCSDDFQKLFSVRFPDWLATKKKTVKIRSGNNASSPIDGSEMLPIPINKVEKFLDIEGIRNYPGLKEFFQKEIKDLKELHLRPWQQRMDMIITAWNTLHPEASVYKYTKYKKNGNGALWKTMYGIDSSESFQKLFSVNFPDWLKTKRRGVRSQKVARAPSLIVSSASIFPSISPSGGALQFHKDYGSGQTHRISDASPIPNDLFVDTDDDGESVPRRVSGKSSPKILKKVDEVVPIEMPKFEKVAIRKEALSFLNPFIKDALAKYVKGKTLPWMFKDFSGIPEAPGLLEAQYGKKSVNLILKGCPPNEGDIWNAFSANDFVAIMKKNPNVRYNESDRVYKITTEDGILIHLHLPPKFSAPKLENSQSSETNTYSIDKLKSQLEENIDAYLAWYYKRHKAQLLGIDLKEFLAGRLPRQFRSRQEGQSFTSEIFLLSGADFSTDLRQSLLDALHDFPELQEFCSQRSMEGFFVNSVKGDKKGINFSLKANGGSSEVIFHPYKQ